MEPTAENIRSWLVVRIAHYLGEPTETIDLSMSLLEYGLDSVYAFTLCGEIEDTLSVIVEPAEIWDMETLVNLTDHIAGLAIRSAQS